MSRPVPEEVVFGYINGVGNHELKTLLAGLFIQRAGEFVTAAAMAGNVNNLQGDRPIPWDVQSAHIIQFCERSLEPVGAVVKGKAIGSSGKEVAAWRAESPYIDVQRFMTGFLSGWSLRWHDLSVQQAYGGTTSPSDVRSPKVRHNVYAALLNMGGEASVTTLRKQLEGAGYSQENSFSDQIRILTDHGILEQSSKRKDYNPTIKIINAEYKHVAIKLEDTIPETQALYRAIQATGVDATISVNELVDRAAKIDPQLDTTKLRMLLVHGLYSRTKNYPGLKIAGEDLMPEEDFTRVRITKSAQEPISELVEGIDDIQRGRRLDEYDQIAARVTTSPVEFRALVAKASRFSPYRAGHYHGREKLNAQVQSVVHDLGVATAEEVHFLLNDVYGRRLSMGRVREVLSGLVDNDLLTQTEVRQHRHSRRLINLYS